MTMGQLSRARSVDAKDARRAAILAVAMALFERDAFAAVTMADVARRSRLAKGTVFLYFPTKEALFLGLLQAQLEPWLAALHAAVAREDSPLTSEQLAGSIAESLAPRPALLRLLPLLAGVLEPNVTPARLAEFRHTLLRRFFATGALVEQRLRLARQGDGVRLLRYAFAVVTGLRADDDADLRTALTILCNGFHRKGA